MRKAKPQNTDNIKRWRRWGLESLTGTHRVQPLWKTDWQVSRKLGTPLPCGPAVLFPAIYPKALKTYAHTKAHTWIFTAALFITAETRKQPMCQPSEDRTTPREYFS